jgi:hypothetical protein
MKKVLLAVALIGSIGVAQAQWQPRTYQVQVYQMPNNIQPVHIPMPQYQNNNTTYTNSSGAVVARSYSSGNNTTYTNSSGAVIGRSYSSGNTTTYTGPSGEIAGRSYGY